MPSDKEKKILKAIILSSSAVLLAVGIYLAIVMFFTGNHNFFTRHFALPIVLLMLGAIAFTLPLATRTKFGGDDSKDKVMMVVAIIAVLLAILTFALSFTNVSFIQ